MPWLHSRHGVWKTQRSQGQRRMLKKPCKLRWCLRRCCNGAIPTKRLVKCRLNQELIYIRKRFKIHSWIYPSNKTTCKASGQHGNEFPSQFLERINSNWSSLLNRRRRFPKNPRYSLWVLWNNGSRWNLWNFKQR